MRRILEILRIILVSYEMIALSIIILLSYYWPSWFESLGHQIRNNSDILKYIPTIPLAFFAAAVQMSNKILKPKSDGSNKILYEWSDYWKLKFRALLSIFTCLICGVISISIWVFSKKISAFLLGLLLLTCIVIAAIVCLCQLLAVYKVREILEE